MAENKITKEELDNILQFQNRLYSLSTDVGILETQKHALLHELAGVNNEQEEWLAHVSWRAKITGVYAKYFVRFVDASLEIQDE